MSVQDPLVSIIIPCHNRIDWLREALDSVLAQTYPALEILLVDDGSTPPVQSLLDVPDPRLRWLRRESAGGPGCAREAGRLAARGEFIQYLDSDDILHPRKIETQVRALQRDPGAGMCYCTSLIFRERPGEPDMPVWSLSGQPFERILPGLLTQRPWATTSCLWRCSVTDATGPWSDLRVGEDIEYESRAGCLETRVLHVPEALCFLRRDPSQAGLTSETPEHQAAETGYKLRVADNLLRTRYAADPAVRARLFALLYNQAVFLLSQRQTRPARECLRAARQVWPGAGLESVRLAARLLPAELALRYARLLRRGWARAGAFGA